MSESKSLTLLEHFEELRHRLFIAVIWLVVAVAGSMAFGEKVVTFLTQPIGGLGNLQAIEVTENVGVFMRVSLLTGFILASPVILYELLMFILPGLTRSEKRYVLFSIPLATIFFLGGVIFAFEVMLPSALPFLTSFLGVETTPRLSSYINFVTNMVFWIGVSFELPLVIYIIARFGVVTPKGLLKYWRYAVLAIAILAAVITPTVDPVNMGLLMLPLTVLYFVSVLFAWFAQRSRKIKDQPEEMA